MHQKFNDAWLAGFRASCFGHLESVDSLAFSSQLVYELLLYKVGNQRVKDLERLTYLIGYKVTRFMKNDFCLITRLRCGKPYNIKVKPSNIRLFTKYFPEKIGFVGESSKGKGWKGKVTCAELEKAFKECKNKDDALKMVLVYFTKGVLIGAKSNVAVNLDYFEFVDDMYRFNREGDEEWMILWKEMGRRKRKKAYEIILQLDKPLSYCKMTDPTTNLRILRWSTTKK
ncbi:unnamed protein product [Malus baccata var. baccata]